VRVIAGSLGGRTLIAPRGSRTRPTADRVREALFSILGDVGGLTVLDLYAGSGALAIEALSRGASAATLVDNAPAAVAAIKRNLSALGLEAEVRRQDATSFVKQCARLDGCEYDLVFLDPPYRSASSLVQPLSTALAAVLSETGRVVVESDRRAPLALRLPLRTERQYGDTLIRIHGP
jgi:16S rRNA (guanine(966)-N(2))-methyltransferase RsmD